MENSSKLAIFGLALLMGAGFIWFAQTNKKMEELFSDPYDFDESDVEQTLGV